MIRKTGSLINKWNKTVCIDGIDLYRGVNMEPNHHKKGLKYYLRFIKINPDTHE